jgi:hypothetical protein
MGLQTTHGCWEGAYSNFRVWRKKLADLAHYSEEFCDALATADTIEGIWNEEPTDVLFVLLLHSDTQYSIPHRYCSALADRLEGLLKIFNIKNPSVSEFDLLANTGFPSRTQQFIDGLRLAASLKEDVEFH